MLWVLTETSPLISLMSLSESYFTTKDKILAQQQTGKKIICEICEREVMYEII